jgi:FkbM family methyltransferase
MKSLRTLCKTVGFIRSHPLNKRSKGGLIRFLRFQLGSRLLPNGSVLPFVGDTRLLVKSGMTGATGNYYCGLHEFEEMSFLLHLLRDSDVFADVGANIGSYTILATGVCGARTYSFEPCLATYRRLCDNIRLNDLTTRIQAFNMAVGASDGVLKFMENQDTMNHVVLGQGQEGMVMVQVKSLDAVLKNDVPCLVKIDVEGFETEVIKGAAQTLSSEKCVAVIMEVGGGARYGFDERTLHNKIQQYGFTPYSYDPFSRRLTAGESGVIGNAIYVRDVEWVRARVQSASMRDINGVRI